MYNLLRYFDYRECNGFCFILSNLDYDMVIFQVPHDLVELKMYEPKIKLEPYHNWFEINSLEGKEIRLSIIGTIIYELENNITHEL